MTTLVLLVGCENSLSTVDPAGPAADVIATLWWIMLAGATLIFVFVMVLLALTFRRPGVADADKPLAEDGAARGREKVWLVGLGLCFPLVVLAALLAYGLVIGERLLPRDDPAVVTVHAEGRQWEWRFSYADAPDLVTENVLHIPAATPVDVRITTVDVIHSFWVPRLAGKLDALPGHENVLRIEAWKPGRYAGVSAEYNGPGFLGHQFVVIAHDAEGWSAFLTDGAP